MDRLIEILLITLAAYLFVAIFTGTVRADNWDAALKTLDIQRDM